MWKTGAILALLLLPGCLTLAEQPATVSSCSFEQVWETSLAAVSDMQIQTADKSAGVFETNWLEVVGARQAGILKRDVTKERFKYVVEVTRDGIGTVWSVLQLREEWSPMGVRMRQWQRMQGNHQDTAAVSATIARRLKDKGC